MQYASARDFFEAVREASRDAERCRVQLESMEHRALAISSPSLQAHVRGGERDRMGRTVAALCDRENELQGRIEDDYRLIDLACWVLFGRDGQSDGLATLMPPWVADALYQFYVAGRTWTDTAALVLYSVAHVRREVGVALDLMDANGMLATIEGRGAAEG